MKVLIAVACLLMATAAVAVGLHDPTRPPQARAAARAIVRDQLPRVSAVFTRGEVRKAIVDGRLVKTGDDIAGGRILAVLGEGVRWVRKGVSHELKLPGAVANFKKPAANSPRVANGDP